MKRKQDIHGVGRTSNLAQWQVPRSLLGKASENYTPVGNTSRLPQKCSSKFQEISRFPEEVASHFHRKLTKHLLLALVLERCLRTLKANNRWLMATKRDVLDRKMCHRRWFWFHSCFLHPFVLSPLMYSTYGCVSLLASCILDAKRHNLRQALVTNRASNVYIINTLKSRMRILPQNSTTTGAHLG